MMHVSTTQMHVKDMQIFCPTKYTGRNTQSSFCQVTKDLEKPLPRKVIKTCDVSLYIVSLSR